MAFTLISHVGRGNGTSGSIDTSTATLLVRGTGWFSATSTKQNPSDNKTNAWVPAQQFVSSLSGALGQTLTLAKQPVTVGTGHTFTETVSFPAFVVAAFTASTEVWVDSKGLTAQTAGATSLALGSFAPSGATSLLALAFLQTDGISGTVSIDDGFTVLDQVVYVGGTNYGVCMAYKIVSVATTFAPTFSWVSSQPAAGSLWVLGEPSTAGGSGGGAWGFAG